LPVARLGRFVQALACGKALQTITQEKDHGEKAQQELGLLALWTRVGKLERRLKFNPQCQLSHTVSAGVTEASGKNLSE